MLGPIIRGNSAVPVRPERPLRQSLQHDRAIFTDIDQSLLGDAEALRNLVEVLRKNRSRTAIGIATGRRLDSALAVLRAHKFPMPDILITSGGTEIHYAPELTEDTTWRRLIDKTWTPKVVRRILRDVPGLELQPSSCQSRLKISYFIDPATSPPLEELTALLHGEQQFVNTIVSFGQFLDILPIHASKGLALRYVANRWSIPAERLLVAGGSGADEDMMRGNPLAVVVANRHSEELSLLADVERFFFASEPYAGGILQALQHYDFFGACRAPEELNP